MCHQPEISLGNFTFTDIPFKKHRTQGGCKTSWNFPGNAIDLWAAAEPKGRKMTGHHTSGRTDYIKLPLEYSGRARRQYNKKPAMSWWQEPISAAKKIFPTASVLLVNVCVCVGCRREPGKTSWVLDQKVGDFVILYRMEANRIIRKSKCIFFVPQVTILSISTFLCVLE